LRAVSSAGTEGQESAQIQPHLSGEATGQVAVSARPYTQYFILYRERWHELYVKLQYHSIGRMFLTLGGVRDTLLGVSKHTTFFLILT